jgi:lipopolysaccharide export LptBFGC system permease protein LptF
MEISMVLKTMLGLAALTAAAAALAAPKAESAAECGIAADMAIVARSLAEEQVQRPQAGAIMARIYDVSESARGKELMKDILEAAYRPTEDTPSQKFAEELFATCMKTGGNMDTVLGRSL